MSLDLFASNIDDAVNYAARVSAPELPSTFSDNFNDAWNKGYLTSQSISGEIRKTRARSELVDSAIAKTGDQSFGQIERDGFLDPQIFNAKLAEHKAARPELDVQPISDEAIQARADEIGKAQLATSTDFARRERTAGGTFGQLVGAGAAAVADPVNLIAFPLAAPESLGILGTALAWGGIGAGSQTVIEALNASSMERIQPGYGASGQPITNILETAAGGAVLGGAIKGLASAWTRAKTGSWPRTVRDAGNVIESEAQIAGTNPLVPPESIANAAVVAKDGTIFTGSFHGEAFEKAVAAGNSAESLRLTDGFVTTTGRYVDRVEASKIAAARDQFRTKDDYLTQVSALGEKAQASFAKDYDKALAGEGGLYAQHVRQYGDASQGVAGEAAHRTALNKAIDDIANGRPVDVESIVPAEQFAAREAAIDPVIAARDASVEARQAAKAAADDAALPDIAVGKITADARGLGSYMDIAQAWAKDPEAVYNKLDVLRQNVLQAEKALKKKYGVKKVEDLEDAPLTDAERHFLFYETSPTSRESIDAITQQLQPVDSMAEAAREIAHEFKRLPTDLSKMNDTEQLAVMRLQVLFSEVGRLGGDLNQVLKEAGSKYAARFSDPNDALFMAQNAADSLRKLFAEKQQSAPALQLTDQSILPGSPQRDLPFVPTALDAQAELHQGTLTQGIQDIARLAGHDMPADEAAKIAARILQLNDPDKARALLDEVFLRPQTIADTLPVVEKPVKPAKDATSPDAVNALRDELTPAKIEEARVHPDMEETVARDLDKLMLEKPGLEVPTGVTVDADGKTVPTTRKVEAVVAEADARSAAAKEIEACVGPYPATEAA